MKILYLVLSGFLLAGSFSANADFTQTDYRDQGDQLVIIDNETGYNWLSFNETFGMSINAVLAETDEGGIFEGFEVASAAVVADLMERTFPSYYVADTWQYVAGLRVQSAIDFGSMFGFVAYADFFGPIQKSEGYHLPASGDYDALSGIQLRGDPGSTNGETNYVFNYVSEYNWGASSTTGVYLVDMTPSNATSNSNESSSNANSGVADVPAPLIGLSSFLLVLLSATRKKQSKLNS
jgi:hypothetical protein